MLMLSFWGYFNLSAVGFALWFLTKDYFSCGYAPVLILVLVGAAIVQYLRIPPPISDDKFWDSIDVIAHRGAAEDAPENTLYALQWCSDNGVQAVEIDIGLTKDKQLIVLHDDTVDRTTDGRGLAADFTLQELSEFDAAIHHTKREISGFQKIPTLRETLLLAKTRNLKLFLDVKPHGGDDVVNGLVKLYHEIPGLYDMTMMSSFSPYIIYKIRSALPNATVGITHHANYYSYTSSGVPKFTNSLQKYWFFVKDKVREWSLLTWVWYVVGNKWYVLHHKEISPQVKQFWADRGIKLMTWTVDPRPAKNYFKHLKIPYITDTVIS